MKRFIVSLLIVAFALFSTGVDAFAIDSTEYLKVSKKVAKKSPTNIVVTNEETTTVIEHNVIEVSFAQNFSTKTAQVGDEVDFILNEGLQTTSGLTILPQGTILVSKITTLEKPKSFNRSGKVGLEFVSLKLPNGTQMPFNAKIFSKKDKLSRGKLNGWGKGLGTTLGMGAIGVGAGCGIGVAAGAVIVGGFAIGLPVGIAVGAMAGLMTPGLHYKAKAGDKIMIQLTDSLQIAK